jgi:hypothetical protein
MDSEEMRRISCCVCDILVGKKRTIIVRNASGSSEAVRFPVFSGLAKIRVSVAQKLLHRYQTNPQADHDYF